MSAIATFVGVGNPKHFLCIFSFLIRFFLWEIQQQQKEKRLIQLINSPAKMIRKLQMNPSA
jgi:hypothetical protein